MTDAVASRITGRKRSKRARPKPNGWAWAGIIIVAVGLLLAIFGPLLAPHGVGEIISDSNFEAPGETTVMGTDALGRDLLSRLLYGAQLTVGLALAATVVGFLIGMAVGFSAAEVGGRYDDFVTWLIDTFLSFPPLMLALIVIAALSSSLPVLIGVIAILHASRVARVGRAIAMNVAALEFVEVARARGEKLFSILVREIWPSTIRPLAVEFGLRMTYSILFLSSLSFLGLGIQPPDADWGSMVRENMDAISVGKGHYLPVLAPAFAIAILTVGVNLIVDWLGAQSGRGISEELTK
ncbi:MAG: ABC transporter permease [Alphaproteobacteria bacterium]|jgi:peptide/nickel transport system permease protein|nr:ABC transporter permease [Rhodospirillaceae bacterium]MBT6202875.1 ABC transporter permease [Rhodospirillaceae bacterium]MBT6512926.1 ABC transporter permease [Rhodospirillaceae bacterium]MBT7615032.1 ABC transporter permease [Rhodospirillaceae bacterium]MDG2483146.1 ABC transporter permease [Alphaproteobacteria bacterium]